MNFSSVKGQSVALQGHHDDARINHPTVTQICSSLLMKAKRVTLFSFNVDHRL